MQLEPLWVYPPSLHPLVFVVVSVLGAALFVLSGMLVSVPLLRRDFLPRQYFAIGTILSSCAIGLVLHSLFLVDTRLGKLACLGIYVGCVGIIAWALRWWWQAKPQHLKPWIRAFLLPICLALSVSIFYNSLTMTCERAGYISTKTQFCAIIDTTFDNSLPLSFAVAAYNGVDKPAVSDWTGGDRPPLQSGVMLLQLPLASRIGSLTANYQAFACFLQCLWIVALWEFLHLVVKNGKRLVPVLVIAIFNSFIFANSVFVWPKLLSAALMLFALVVGLRAAKAQRLQSSDVVLFAAGSALAMLAHGGVIFTLVPSLALLIFWTWRYITLRHALLFGVTVGLLYAPWALYRATYHVAGDRLIKWWLAGRPAVDQTPTTTAIIEAYKALTPHDILANKLGNIRTLAGSMPDYVGPISNRVTMGALWNMEGTYFLPSFGFAWFGVVGLVRTLRKKRKRYFQTYYYESRALAMGLLSLAFWVLLSFGPPDAPTVAYAGSYATFLILFATFLIYLTRTPRLLAVVAVANVVYFCVITSLYLDLADRINQRYAMLSVLSVVFIGYLLKCCLSDVEPATV